MPAPIYGPEGASLFIPTGPAPDYTQFIENDPFYKQNITWINDAQKLANDRLIQDKAFAEKAYGINVAQAQAGASGGGDYGLAAAQRAAALEKEKAAHDNANRAEYLREWLGGRGMVSSGQNAWEQNERTYQYDMLGKQIDSDLQGRADAAASARAEAQSRLSMQLAELQLNQEARMMGLSRETEDLALSSARARGEAGLDLYNRLLSSGKLNAPGEMAIWDEESQLYVTKDGRYYDRFATLTPWSRKPAAGGGGGGAGGGGGDAGSGYVAPGPEPYGYSRPVENVIPGDQWGYF